MPTDYKVKPIYTPESNVLHFQKPYCFFQKEKASLAYVFFSFLLLSFFRQGASIFSGIYSLNRVLKMFSQFLEENVYTIIIT